MSQKYLNGAKIQLTAIDLEKDSALFSKWAKNGEYLRLMDSDPATMFCIKDVKDWHEK
mgnify:FL=1